ncbi:MAG TPA: lysophospholipid acyltransferase family protein [Polyangiaceae bacterium]|jgi:1-acyl-sn-glycerol-3-phosphate acyltransferase
MASPKAASVPPPSAPVDDRDASVRLLEAEGADRPARRPHPRPPKRPVRVVPETLVATPEPPPVPVDRPSDPSVAQRIRELEQRLDAMIGEHAKDAALGDEDARTIPRSEPPPSRSTIPPAPDSVLDTARELLSTDFYLRKWGRLGLRNRSEEVDEFGYDPVYEQKVLPLFEFLYDKYFRVEVHGAANVPEEGRCLLVANHSGTLPFDGIMLRLAVRREHPRRREVRWLAEDAIFHFPFLGSFTHRVGAVRACQENAERLLDHGALVAVFPEGMKGIGKLFRDRYKLQRFGRGGFVKLGLRTRTPVVPVAIVGAEETNPMISRVEYLTRAIGIPYLPVTPTFPLLGPLGLLPAPTKWKIYFGEPVDLDGYGAEAAEDEVLVGRLNEQIRGQIQQTLDKALRARRSVWFG